MATIRKENGRWRAAVQRQGVRKSKTFGTKGEARDWAAQIEADILKPQLKRSRTTLAEALERYKREVSPKKRGHRWEAVRLGVIARSHMAKKPIQEVTSQDIAAWRDHRLTEIAPASVRREMNLISSVFSTCRDEWGLVEGSPARGVKKPREPEARSRRVELDEIERLRHVAGEDWTTATSRAFAAFLFAIETGMRAGEIVRLSWADITGRVAHLPKTKNGSARDVPLSSTARAILDALPHGDPVFGLSSSQLDALFRKSRDRAAIENLRFHDSRHEAVTRLSKKLDVLDLAKMIGHRDIRELMTYYEPDAASLVSKLD